MAGIRQNIWIQFTPFLLIYVVIAVVWAPDNLVGDEYRYIDYANNLLDGFFSPPLPETKLWNGPGYSLIVSILFLFKLPLMAVRILNGILLYTSLIIIFKAINIYTSRKHAFFFALIMGFYFPVYMSLRFILTEVLAWFLVSLVCYLFLTSLKRKSFSWLWIILAAFSIAYLAMTKTIFGYVILLLIILALILLLFPAWRVQAKRASIIFVFSMVLCLPYLAYTYSLTGKIFYWSEAGGLSLYTMSTLHQDELGDWNKIYENPNHAAFCDSISQLNSIERDDAFKKKALENIKANPRKYFTNWISNMGRLFINYPFSNMRQTPETLFFIIPNMIVLVFIIAALISGILRPKTIPAELIVLSLFFLIYLAASSLLSAYNRMFYITVPFWTAFIAIVFSKTVSIKLKQKL